MKNLMWQLFLQTGDVETYLLFKQIEDESDEGKQHDYLSTDLTLNKTKM